MKSSLARTKVICCFILLILLSKIQVQANCYDNYVTLYEVDPISLTRKVIYQNPHSDVAVELTKF